MDRLFIITIINNYITTKEKDLIKIINTTLNNYDLYSQEEDWQKEIELLYNLFNQYPYYLLLNVIDQIKFQFQQISFNHPEYLKYAILINGYFLELVPTVKRRMETEVNGHLIYLLKKYYERDNKMPDNVKKILKTNLYSPELLVGYNLLKDEQYHQEQFVSLTNQDMSEKISMNNYKRFSRSFKFLTDLVLKYYSSNDFDKFVIDLETIFINLNKEDSNTMIIDEIFFEQIAKINQSLSSYENKLEELELLKYIN